MVIITGNGIVSVASAAEMERRFVPQNRRQLAGTCAEAVDSVTGQRVILQQYGMDDSVGVPHFALQELAALHQLRHPNVAELYSIYLAPHLCWSVLEHCGGTMREHLSRCGPFRSPCLQRVAFQCVRAVDYLHGRGVLHCGLRTKALHYDAHRERVVIADLRWSHVGSPFASDVAVVHECAPEILLGRRACGLEADIWSLGCVVAELATAETLFPGGSQIGTLFKIFQLLGTPTETSWPGVTSLPHFSAAYPQWPGSGFDAIADSRTEFFDPSGNLCSLLGAVLRYEPARRPAAATLLRHPFFHSAKLGPELRAVASVLAGGAAELGAATRQEAGPLDAAFRDELAELLDVDGARGQPLWASKPEDAVVAPLANRVLGALHEASERGRPAVTAVVEGFPEAFRQDTLQWLLQAFSVMHLRDKLLFDVALLLDRYYAALPPKEREENYGSTAVRRNILAAVLTAVKMDPAGTSTPVHMLISHLGKGSVPFTDVVVAERKMLEQLTFQIGLPTAYDLLEVLGAGLGDSHVHGKSKALAAFLLQLALADVPLYFRYPHVILAAAAWVVAIHTRQGSTYDCMAVVKAVSSMCTAPTCTSKDLAACADALYNLLVHSAAKPQRQTFVLHLRAKFARFGFDFASRIESRGGLLESCSTASASPGDGKEKSVAAAAYKSHSV